ncbi:MAG: hypothetical protein WBC85_13375 [Planktotalea sp.]|uniref:hypothetical protein n=1 Tax=Planktotalea sp. TaxID=2029877 RepID=UPI003C78FA6B
MTKFSNSNTPKSTPYDGILGRENRELDRLVEWLEGNRRAELKEWLEDREQALFDHFEIQNNDDPDRWRELSHALACAHVPAFKAKRGRPRANQFIDSGLTRLFWYLKLTSGHSDASIYRKIQNFIDQNNESIKPRDECEAMTVDVNVAERLKNYKKDQRNSFTESKRLIVDELSEHGEQQVFISCMNAILMSEAAHYFFARQNLQIDKWPHTKENILLE